MDSGKNEDASVQHRYSFRNDFLTTAMYGFTKEPLQRTCAVFLSALSKFKEAVPSSHMESVKDEIMATLLVQLLPNINIAPKNELDLAGS